jgi:molybdenum cofactor synthesis domain-containing protein
VSQKTPYNARVISVSTRASKGIWEDTSGPFIESALLELGLHCGVPVVIPDGEEVELKLGKAIADQIDLVITTGGTGLTPNDLTPEFTAKVIDRLTPGIAEAIRAFGLSHGVASAALSRGIAGVADKTLIINLPGSLGGVRDGMEVLKPILLHALDQINGGDHKRADQ